MGRLWECDVKNAFCSLSHPLHLAAYFGERQMVIWLDSNSNLCEKKCIHQWEGFFVVASDDSFFPMGKNKKHIMMPGNQPETSIFQLMSLFVRVESLLFFALFFFCYDVLWTGGSSLVDAVSGGRRLNLEILRNLNKSIKALYQRSHQPAHNPLKPVEHFSPSEASRLFNRFLRSHLSRLWSVFPI